MSKYNLAQVNIAKVLAHMDDPIMKGFVDNLDAIYQISDTHAGFISRINNEDYPTELSDAFPDESFIVNISVWKDLEALFDFTYKSGHVPTHKEAKQRLDYINKHGYTPYAFSFKDKFSIADSLNYKPLNII